MLLQIFKGNDLGIANYISIILVQLKSLLDVFVFAFYPMFFPMIAMAVACRIYDIQCSRE